MVLMPDTWKQYLLMVYTGFFPFGIGEICPRLKNEFFFGVGFLLFGGFYSAYIIGEITT